MLLGVVLRNFFNALDAVVIVLERAAPKERLRRSGMEQSVDLMLDHDGVTSMLDCEGVLLGSGGQELST